MERPSRISFAITKAASTWRLKRGNVCGVLVGIVVNICREGAAMAVTTIPPATEGMTNEKLGKNQCECLEAKPQANPSREANPENDLYEIWKNSDEASRPEVEMYLLPHLRRHAAKVGWMVLHSYQSHLVDEIAQDAVMDLKTFEGRSAFSTWFHARALKRCYNERRNFKRRKEISLTDFNANTASKASFETRVIVQELLGHLDAEDLELVELKVQEGLVDAEIAEFLGIPRATVQYRWDVVRKKLRAIYNGRHTAE